MFLLSLQVWGARPVGKRLLWAGVEGLWPQGEGECCHQDRKEWCRIREGGKEWSENPATSFGGGPWREWERGPHEGQLCVQEPHLHRLWDDGHQPLWADQEETVQQVPKFSAWEFQQLHILPPRFDLKIARNFTHSLLLALNTFAKMRWNFKLTNNKKKQQKTKQKKTTTKNLQQKMR